MQKLFKCFIIFLFHPDSEDWQNLKHLINENRSVKTPQTTPKYLKTPQTALKLPQTILMMVVVVGGGGGVCVGGWGGGEGGCSNG